MKNNIEYYLRKGRNVFFKSWDDFVNNIFIQIVCNDNVYYVAFDKISGCFNYYQFPNSDEYMRIFNGNIVNDSSHSYGMISYFKKDNSSQFEKDVITRKPKADCDNYTNFRIINDEGIDFKYPYFCNNIIYLEDDEYVNKEMTDYELSLIHDKDLQKRRHEVYERLNSIIIKKKYK